MGTRRVATFGTFAGVAFFGKQKRPARGEDVFSAEGDAPRRFRFFVLVVGRAFLRRVPSVGGGHFGGCFRRSDLRCFCAVRSFGPLRNRFGTASGLLVHGVEDVPEDVLHDGLRRRSQDAVDERVVPRAPWALGSSRASSRVVPEIVRRQRADVFRVGERARGRLAREQVIQLREPDAERQVRAPLARDRGRDGPRRVGGDDRSPGRRRRVRDVKRVRVRPPRGGGTKYSLGAAGDRPEGPLGRGGGRELGAEDVGERRRAPRRVDLRRRERVAEVRPGRPGRRRVPLQSTPLQRQERG